MARREMVTNPRRTRVPHRRILGRRLRPMVLGTEPLELDRLVAAAVDLGHDVIDIGRGAIA